MSPYKRPTANLAGAASGNRQQLEQMLRQIHARLDDLERKTGSGVVDPDQQAPVTAPPPHAQLSVTAVPTSGRFVVRIINPEYLGKGNSSRTPLLHILESSTSPDFSANVISYPPSQQTYYEIAALGSTTRYWQIRSSFDGKSYNQPVVSGAHTS